MAAFALFLYLAQTIFLLNPYSNIVIESSKFRLPELLTRSTRRRAFVPSRKQETSTAYFQTVNLKEQDSPLNCNFRERTNFTRILTTLL